jgi:AcrR family transcriptional regulator
MSDIAREVNVGASAIYRHFRGKSELLVAAIQAGIAPYAEVVDAASRLNGTPGEDLQTVVHRMAECALDHRQLGVLWQREARNLEPAEQKVLREELGATTRGLAGFIERARPELEGSQTDLLAWCAIGVLVSVGFHSLTLPRDEYVGLLVELVTTVIGLRLPAATTGDPREDPRGDAIGSRRDVLVSQATELFAERGFGAVGVDDIGDAVGIAGPSVYSHFESKQRILVEAIRRGNDLLRADVASAMAGGSTPQVALGQLVDSFVGLAVANRFVVRIVLSELDQLDPADREFARREQREYIETWTGLLARFTDLEPVPARIRVQAVLLVVNDAVQTPHLRSQAGFEAALRHVARAMLGL